MYIHNESHKNKPVKETLSTREKQIVELLAKGLTQKEIAISLKISVKTVQTYVTRILIKTKATNSTNAVANYVKAECIKDIGTNLISKIMQVVSEQSAGYERGIE